MLPLYLPVRVAEKVAKQNCHRMLLTYRVYNVQMLFIGEAAQIFNFTDKSVMKAPKKGVI